MISKISVNPEMARQSLPCFGSLPIVSFTQLAFLPVCLFTVRSGVYGRVLSGVTSFYIWDDKPNKVNVKHAQTPYLLFGYPLQQQPQSKDSLLTPDKKQPHATVQANQAQWKFKHLKEGPVNIVEKCQAIP